MAKAFFNEQAEEAGIRLRTESAGIQPAESVHPVVEATSREVGIDVHSAEPQLMANETVERAWQVITMRCAVDVEGLARTVAARCGGAENRRARGETGTVSN